MPRGNLVGAEWNTSVRGETPEQRADRNLQELLAELRVCQTGVQILFGFLLMLAFQDRFTDIDAFAETVYLVTLLLCAGATALLIAPVAYHRTMFRRGRKEEVVVAAHRFAQVGLLVLLLAMSGAVLLILDIVASRPVAVVAGAGVGVMFALLWVALPLSARLRRRPQHPPSGE